MAQLIHCQLISMAFYHLDMVYKLLQQIDIVQFDYIFKIQIIQIALILVILTQYVLPQVV